MPIRISQLPAATTLTNDALVIVEVGGSTKVATVLQVQQAAAPAPPITGPDLTTWDLGWLTSQDGGVPGSVYNFPGSNPQLYVPTSLPGYVIFGKTFTRTGHFTIDFSLQGGFGFSTGVAMGLCLFNKAQFAINGECLFFGFRDTGGGLEISKWANGAIVSIDLSATVAFAFPFLKLAYDGTSFTLSYGIDGATWWGSVVLATSDFTAPLNGIGAFFQTTDTLDVFGGGSIGGQFALYSDVQQ
jgi:hypothetical protein